MGRVISVVTLLALGLGGCGRSSEPAGTPRLPDLVPEPPIDLRVVFEGGATLIQFSSTLVNVGDGDFLLRAHRSSGAWLVEQEISYSESGSKIEPIEVEMVWGGDGHGHWHVKRVAIYWLVELGDDGEPLQSELGFDTKVGFCFYDHTRVSDGSVEEPRYFSATCGEQDDSEIRMGLSAGWSDIYPFTLPGQTIDVTELPDGFYRVWVEVDRDGRFADLDRGNNRTWIDIELMTTDGQRFARLDDVGPQPED